MRRILAVAVTLAAALALSTAAFTAEKDAADQSISSEAKAGPGEGKSTAQPQSSEGAGANIITASEAPIAEKPVVEDPFSTALKAALAEEPEGSAGNDRADVAALATFYETRAHAPLWTTTKGFSAGAEAVIGEIRQADDWGLDANDFTLPILPPDPGKEDLAKAEAAIGMATLKYARFARGGRLDPRSLTKFLDRSPPLLEPAAVLEQITAAGDPAAYLRGLHPQHRQFELLRQAYLKMRQSPDVVVSAEKVPSGPKLSTGIRHPHVALVRARLGITFTGSPGDEVLYDESLAEAVKEFQTNRGELVDGIVGSATRQALNTIETGGSRRLLANMEQWRWMPEDMGDFHVWVNIPDFMIRVVQNGQVIHAERIVVGKVDTQTPVFSDELEQVIFHPFWGVPDSIKRNELQPHLAAGASILARQGLRVQYRGRDVDPDAIDWQAMDMRNVHIYQPPGPSNVLGVVKFRFPNKHDVYFHDTPQKHLFSAGVRTFSHGCMRVQNPLRLAELFLGRDKSMPPDRVRSLASPGAPQDNQINLTNKVPVHITYFTASVDETENVAYRKDIYGHEERIALGLEGKMHLVKKVPEPAPPTRVVRDQGFGGFGGFSGGGPMPPWMRRVFNF